MRYKASSRLCDGCGLYMIGADGLTERTQYCVDCLHKRDFYNKSQISRLKNVELEEK